MITPTPTATPVPVFYDSSVVLSDFLGFFISVAIFLLVAVVLSRIVSVFRSSG